MLAAAAHRITHEELERRRDQQAGHAHRDEGNAPIERLGDHAAERQAHCPADRDAEGIHAKRTGTFAGREIVGDHRIRRCHPAGFADAHAQPRHEQAGEAGRHAAQCREAAPDAQRDGDNPRAATAIRQPADGNSDRRVQQRESGAAEQTQLSVGQAQVGLDRGRHDAKQHAVGKIEDVHQQQQRQHQEAIAGSRPRSVCRIAVTCHWRFPACGSARVGSRWLIVHSPLGGIGSSDGEQRRMGWFACQ